MISGPLRTGSPLRRHRQSIPLIPLYLPHLLMDEVYVWNVPPQPLPPYYESRPHSHRASTISRQSHQMLAQILQNTMQFSLYFFWCTHTTINFTENIFSNRSIGDLNATIAHFPMLSGILWVLANFVKPFIPVEHWAERPTRCSSCTQVWPLAIGARHHIQSQNPEGLCPSQ